MTQGPQGNVSSLVKSLLSKHSLEKKVNIRFFCSQQLFLLGDVQIIVPQDSQPGIGQLFRLNNSQHAMLEADWK